MTAHVSEMAVAEMVSLGVGWPADEPPGSTWAAASAQADYHGVADPDADAGWALAGWRVLRQRAGDG